MCEVYVRIAPVPISIFYPSSFHIQYPNFMPNEIYYSVDVETAGPIPGEYSMLSIGACVVGDKTKNFYIELAPLNENYTDEAMATGGMTLTELKARGVEPRAAMQEFARWVNQNANGARAIFVGFNAPFDWSFVNYYFVKFLGVKQNPFGHSALDIKSYYMGAYGTHFEETSMRRLPPEIHPPNTPLTHNALDDALQQAKIFERLLEQSGNRETLHSLD